MAVDYQRKLFHTDDSELSVLMKIYDISERMFEESVERLNDWYKLQPHLPKIEIEDRFLKRIIATNGFSVEKAKSKFDNLSLVRSTLPEFFSGRDAFNKEFEQIFEAIDLAIVPQMTDKHYRTTILRIRDCDPNLFDPIMMFKVIFMVADLEIWFDTMAGAHIIWDCTDTRLAHIVKITPVIIKKFFFIFQKCYGAKLKSIHLINAPSYTSTLITAAKMMMKKKLGERIFSHNSLEELHEHISPKYLPKELGGDQKSYSELSNNLKESFQSKQIIDVLNYLDQIKSDESKRINSSQTAIDDLLGITGTFRKLDVD